MFETFVVHFRFFCKISKSDFLLPHISLSSRMKRLCSLWTDFHEILCLHSFENLLKNLDFH